MVKCIFRIFRIHTSNGERAESETFKVIHGKYNGSVLVIYTMFVI